MQTYPVHQPPKDAKGFLIPIQKIEAFSYQGTVYVIETQADYTLLPAFLQAAVNRRPNARQVAIDAELAAAFEAKQAADAKTSREAAYTSWANSDPVATEIKNRVRP